MEFTVHRYLDDPLDAAQLRALIEKVGGDPAEMVRADLGTDVTVDRVVEHLVANPGDMQRPIVEVDDRAVIARPPERLLGLLS